MQDGYISDENPCFYPFEFEHKLGAAILKEHDLLMSVRNGEYLNENGKPKKSFYDIVDDYEKRFDYAKTPPF